MMYTDNEFQISNKSYTNKDFESIYPELLDLVKTLTDKWDPSTSNESDPGVVLIKLAAIIADKLNYNVDKNILETFPLSVTQRGNAHKLYDMLGYSMKWYRAATTKIHVTYSGRPIDLEKLIEAGLNTIPKWTMFTNDSGNIIYTLLTPITLNKKGNVEEGDVIQGSIHDYEVNGVYDITLDNLDESNRIYFRERMIAENGIFVTNKDSDEYWTNVPNLESAQLSSKIYKFGVLPGSETCYIQFPQDIGNLISNGLKIKYIVTNGEAGNVKANVLTSLYQDIEVQLSDETSYKFGQDLIVKNTSSTSNGSDPEDLDSAYHNYKKTVGTFDTLVTLRDYENAIYQLVDNLGQPLVSNSVVSDRTCDINNTVNIVTRTQGGYEKSCKVLANDDGTPTMTAFDLGLYVLQDPGSIIDEYFYNRSFSVHDSVGDIQTLISDRASVNHEYIDTYGDVGKRYLYKNFYRLNGKVITYYKVTKIQAQEIEQNIKTALYKAYNARQVNFGQPVEYEHLMKTIQNADTRIRTVVLAEPEYELRQMYSDDVYGKYSTSKSLLKQSNGTLDHSLLDLLVKMVLGGNVQLYNFDEDVSFRFGQTNITKYSGVSNITTQTAINTEGSFDDDEKVVVSASDDVSVGYKVPEGVNIQLTAPNYYVKTSYTAYVNYELFDSAVSQTYVTTENTTDSRFYFASNRYSIGLVKSNSDYNVVIYERNTTKQLATKSASSFKYEATTQTSTGTLVTSTGTRFVVSFKINTKVTPNTLDSVTVKEIRGTFSVPQNQYYTLSNTQSIFINYTDSNKNVHNEWINPGDTIKFSDSSDSESILATTASTIEKVVGGTTYNVSTLTSSQQIDVVAINETVFEKQIVPCLWFTNSATVSNDAGATTTKYILFDSDETERVLEDNEYFIYTDENRNDLTILGSGTLIKRSEPKGTVSYVSKVSQSTIVSEGSSAITDTDWVKYDTTDSSLTIQELQSVTLGAGAGFRCTSLDATSITNIRTAVENPEYCESFADPVWVKLCSFHDPDVMWKVRSKLNMMAGPAHPQVFTNDASKATTNTLQISSLKMQQQFTGYAAQWHGTILWKSQIRHDNGSTYTVSIDNVVYTFDAENTTGLVKDGNFDLVVKNSPTTVYKVTNHQVVINGQRYFFVFNDQESPIVDELGENQYVTTQIRNKSVVSNAILAFTGGEDRDVASSTEDAINIYSYDAVDLPYIKYGRHIDQKLQYDADDEISITQEFYNMYTQHGTISTTEQTIEPFKSSVLLPFSYSGTALPTASFANTNKKLIVPVTFNCAYSRVKLSAVGTEPTTYARQSAEYDSNSSSPQSDVQFIEFEQTSSNMFKGIQIDSWNVIPQKIKSYVDIPDSGTVKHTFTAITSRDAFADIQFRLNGSNLNYRFEGASSWKSVQQNNLFHLEASDTKDIYGYFIWSKVEDSNRLYVCLTSDFVKIGNIKIIDLSNAYSNQVTKTIERLSGYYGETPSYVQSVFQTKINEYPEFDISYEVPATDSIDTSSATEQDRDYLFSSVAVWDTNHICNKYTIPQLITDSSQYSITVAETSIRN